MKKYLLLSLTLFGSISYAMPVKEDCCQELIEAISRKKNADLKLLLDNNADTAKHVEVAFGTLLEWAVTWDNEAAVKLLLDHGVDVNTQGRWGYTALHLAGLVDYEAEAITRLLLERGADPFIQNKLEDTPLDLAKSDTIRELIKNEISKRRATMIWALNGVHHAGPQAGQELEQEDGLSALPSLSSEIVEKIMLKADPSLEKTLIKRAIERKEENVPFDQIDFSDIIQRFDTSLLTIASALD